MSHSHASQPAEHDPASRPTAAATAAAGRTGAEAAAGRTGIDLRRATQTPVSLSWRSLRGSAEPAGYHRLQPCVSDALEPCGGCCRAGGPNSLRCNVAKAASPDSQVSACLGLLNSHASQPEELVHSRATNSQVSACPGLSNSHARQPAEHVGGSGPDNCGHSSRRPHRCRACRPPVACSHAATTLRALRQLLQGKRARQRTHRLPGIRMSGLFSSHASQPEEHVGGFGPDGRGYGSCRPHRRRACRPPAASRYADSDARQATDNGACCTVRCRSQVSARRGFALRRANQTVVSLSWRASGATYLTVMRASLRSMIAASRPTAAATAAAGRTGAEAAAGRTGIDHRFPGIHTSWV